MTTSSESTGRRPLTGHHREICPTADGSVTLYIPEIDEHYHSVAGALTESEHVYIRCALDHRAATWQGDTPLKVLEFGLGTGMDAMLVSGWAARSGVAVHYTALELYPLSPEEVELLHGCVAIHKSPWNEDVRLGEGMTMRKVLTDFRDFVAESSGRYDVIFYDAFAPDKQPELWTPDYLAGVINLLNPGGVLTTYCAKGAVRRAFAAAGARVERLSGPPGGKREILRATRL